MRHNVRTNGTPSDPHSNLHFAQRLVFLLQTLMQTEQHRMRHRSFLRSEFIQHLHGPLQVELDVVTAGEQSRDRLR